MRTPLHATTRHVLRATAAATATVAVCLLTGTAAAAAPAATPAAPAGAERLYAPSDLVLTVGRGEDAATATVDRAVTLSCAPRPVGTHPHARAACAELAAVEGRFEELTSRATNVMCTKEWDPRVVTASGVWEGRRVSWTATFANGCQMHANLAGSAALAF
ncbi:subtilase-type protease inhibitor [Streptomyces sp. NPDC002851]